MMGPMTHPPEESPPRRAEPHVVGSAQDTHLATSVTAYLLAGPLTFGGLGWLADAWLGTVFLVVVGLLAGMAMSIYVIWLRYGIQ